jgi:hypothetical protein
MIPKMMYQIRTEQTWIHLSITRFSCGNLEKKSVIYVRWTGLYIVACKNAARRVQFNVNDVIISRLKMDGDMRWGHMGL